MRIEDGTGRGFSAKVDGEHRLWVEAVTRTAEREANEDHGDAYHVAFSKSGTANDDCIFYMVNSSESKELVIEGAWLYVSAAVEVSFELNAKGTRNGATALTPTNCHAGSVNAADGTFEHGVDLDGGSATLDGGTEVSMYKFIAETATKYCNFEQDVILSKNQTLTIWSSSSAATITGHVVFNYH